MWLENLEHSDGTVGYGGTVGYDDTLGYDVIARYGGTIWYDGAVGYDGDFISRCPRDLEMIITMGRTYQTWSEIFLE